MKVVIRASGNGLPETEIEYTAYQGFKALGFSPVFYRSEEELEDWQPDTLIVGGITTITRKLESYGIKLPDYDYPEELRRFMKRRVWKDRLDVVLQNQEQWPVFVKPVRDKAFTGFVLQKENSIPKLHKAKPDEPVYCSEVISFRAEWRVFVRYGTICAVRPYKGDWKAQYDPDVIDEMVSGFRSAPAGYSLDVGVTDQGETVLVEVNDGFSLGTYGIDPIEYAKLLSARWCELVGISDECDRYHEKNDWIKTKRK